MSSRDDRTLTQVLQRVAQEARPARLPTDLWSRGRRWYRRRVGAAVAATVVVVSLLAMPAVFVSGSATRHTRGGSAVDSVSGLPTAALSDHRAGCAVRAGGSHRYRAGRIRRHRYSRI